MLFEDHRSVQAIQLHSIGQLSYLFEEDCGLRAQVTNLCLLDHYAFYFMQNYHWHILVFKCLLTFLIRSKYSNYKNYILERYRGSCIVAG